MKPWFIVAQAFPHIYMYRYIYRSMIRYRIQVQLGHPEKTRFYLTLSKLFIFRVSHYYKSLPTTTIVEITQ